MNKRFLSCDWGTSSFRLRLIDVGSGESISESLSDEGISSVYEEWIKAGLKEKQRVHFYFSVIDRHIKKIKQKVKDMEKGMPVIISGMASSNIGMIELPYTILPFSSGGKDIEVKRIENENFFAHELNIISGARTKTDVMRGEETQLIGCANGNMKEKQLFIFTGTHSKHIVTVSGEATDIKTYMTGELFSLLTTHSILADSVWPFGDADAEENSAAFAQGVKNGADHNLSHSLFAVRTNQLLKRLSKEANYYYLSGLLIGAELGELSKTAIDTITIVGEERLTANYSEALKILHCNAHVKKTDAATATIRGQLAIYRRIYQ
ncbi:MAG TPA: 2-dehydro-3-deoxygalactonokinase [Chitinophagaceae bacterium]|nr:2-dehydro-3-deoxygalactonokinase [Chitinophagaceae bacterium]